MYLQYYNEQITCSGLNGLGRGCAPIQPASQQAGYAKCIKTDQ